MLLVNLPLPHPRPRTNRQILFPEDRNRALKRLTIRGVHWGGGARKKAKCQSQFTICRNEIVPLISLSLSRARARAKLRIKLIGNDERNKLPKYSPDQFRFRAFSLNLNAIANIRRY